MAQRMDADLAMDTASGNGSLHRRLHATTIHRRGRTAHVLGTTDRIRKQPLGMTMRLPELTQRLQRQIRQRNIAVFAALGATNVHAMASPDDIPHLQLQALPQTHPML